MYRNDIRPFKQFIKIHTFIIGIAVLSRCRIVYYMTPERLCNVGNPSSYLAKPDYSPCLSGKLLKMLPEIGETAVLAVLSVLHKIIIVSELLIHVKKQCKRVLYYRIRGIALYIRDRNILLRGIFQIYVVRSRRINSYIFKLREPVHLIFTNHNLVRKKRVSILKPFNHLIRCRSLIYCDRPKLFKNGHINVLSKRHAV